MTSNAAHIEPPSGSPVKSLCQAHADEWRAWLDYGLGPSRRFSSSASYDDSPEGVHDRGRLRFADWRETVKFQQTLVEQACASLCSDARLAQPEVANLRIGSTFSGFGGLDMAVLDIFGGQVVWHCENDTAASVVLAHHWPGVPNLGDITAVDWSTVEPIDILTGGFPCQDISFAGQGAGIEGARSGLWRYLADAVRVLRPRIVVLENVSAVLVRGLDRVLADLAVCGYDVRWTCLRASDVGAPHQRNRWFAVAFPNTDGATGSERWITASGQAESRWSWADAGGRGGAPAANTDYAAPCPEPHRESARREAHHERQGIDAAGRVLGWGQYEPAIRRWEAVLGQPAPEPTVLTDSYRAMLRRRMERRDRRPVGMRGSLRPRRALSPAFVEWMMGVPGYITSVPGLSRNDMLRLAGNGVVPQQGAAALRWLLSLTAERAS